MSDLYQGGSQWSIQNHFQFNNQYISMKNCFLWSQETNKQRLVNENKLNKFSDSLLMHTSLSSVLLEDNKVLQKKPTGWEWTNQIRIAPTTNPTSQTATSESFLVPPCWNSGPRWSWPHCAPSLPAPSGKWCTLPAWQPWRTCRCRWVLRGWSDDAPSADWGTAG